MISNLSSDYAAGYFDGEGCVRITSNSALGNNGFGIHVFITNTYKPILESFKFKYGGALDLRDKSTPKHRSCFQWRLSNRRDALVFLLDILPYSIEKKPQIELGIEFCNLKDLKANRFTKGDPKVRERKTEIKVLLSELKRIDYGENQTDYGY